MWQEFDCARDAFCSCFRDVDGVASVVLWRTADVPTVYSVWGPCLPLFWIFVYNHFCAEGCQRRFVIIKRAVELRFGRKARVDVRLSKEVQRGGGLSYETAP